MDYLTVKSVHSGMAYLSGLLFILRFWLFYFQPSCKNNKMLKVLPHIIDTLLLGFAIWLLVILSLSPIAHLWVMAKILALIVYIGLGIVAIKKQKTWAFFSALVVYVYIVGVAHQHHALSWWVSL